MNRRPDRQRGAALIEMVGLLIVAIPLLAGLVVFGRLTWHAVVMEKGVASAARIVAALPSESLVADTALTDLKNMVYEHIAGAATAAGIDAVASADQLIVSCDGLPCTGGTPAAISVAAATQYRDTVFAGAYTEFLLPQQLAIKERYEDSYALPIFPVKALPAPN